MAAPMWNPRNPYYPPHAQPSTPLDGTSPLYCTLCARHFVNETALQNHLRTSNAHKKTIHRTSQPSSRMSQTTHFSGRAETRTNPHYGSQKNPNLAAHCNTCNRDFVNGGALAVHIKNSKIHQSGKTPTVGAIRKSGQNTVARENEIPPKLVTPPPRTFSIGFLPLVTPEQSQQQPIPIARNSQTNRNYNSYGAQHDNRAPWSRIPEHERYETLGNLSRQCHSLEVLSKNGYRTRECTQNEMKELCKCINCGRQRKKIESGGRTDCIFHPWKPSPEKKKTGPGMKKEPIVYLCCGESGEGCMIDTRHEYGPLDPFTKSRLASYAHAPTHEQVTTGKRPAIALDCEMAGVLKGSGELIGEVVRLCAVDYITGETLIDTLVVPVERIIQWRTKYSGVTSAMLADARARGRTLSGWNGARGELWKYMDANTILIGQSLNNDLDALRMVHTRVVDSAIMTKLAVDPNCHRSWGLKTLSSDLLDMKIQNKKGGHDCMEDTLATREVVLECTRNPQKLKAWADNERMLIIEEKEKREQEKREREEKEKEEDRQGNDQGKGKRIRRKTSQSGE